MCHKARYSWVVLAASFVAHYLLYGVTYGLGVFYVIIMETFQAGPTEVSLLCSLFTAVFFGAGPLSSLLVNMWGCRPTTIVGGLLGSLGLILTSYMPELKYLYPTFGIITALGFGLCSTPAVFIVTSYFRVYRTLALGVALSGVGLGAFTYPVIVRMFVHLYGARGAFVLTAALSLHLVLCGAIFRVPLNSTQLRVPPRAKCATSQDCQPEERLCARLQLTIFRNLPFCALCGTYILTGFGQTVVYVHLPAFGNSIGLDDDRAAMLVSAVGIANFVGRFVYASVGQVPCIGVFIPYIFGIVSSGALLFLIKLFHTFAGIMALSLGFGFLFASFGCLGPQTLLEVVGEDFLSTGFGYTLVPVALGSLMGASTAGWLYEQTHNYPISFYLGGGAIMLAGLLSIYPWRGSRHFKTKTVEVDVQSNEKTLLSQEEQKNGETKMLI